MNPSPPLRCIYQRHFIPASAGVGDGELEEYSGCTFKTYINPEALKQVKSRQEVRLDLVSVLT
jgi:hypothetical protein